MKEDELTNEILRVLIEDLAGGGLHDLDSYLARWPDAEERVRVEWAFMHEGGEGGDTASSSPRKEATLPPSFGPYEIEAEIGRGGQAAVHLARDTRLGRRVALKVSALVGKLDPLGRERLAREAQALSRLQHPGLATVFEAGEIDECAFIAMRYIEGPPLTEVLRAAEMMRGADAAVPHTFPPAVGSIARDLAKQQSGAAVQLIEQIADALAASHDEGVVHRDVKPANVILGPGGTPVLVDFGLATTAGLGEDRLTHEDVIAGTPAWLSPERIRGAESPRPGDDVWALAVIAFELLTLRRPFDAVDRSALFGQILTSRYPRVRQLRNGPTPRSLDTVFEFAFAIEESQRYPTARAFADDLRRAVEGRPLIARPPAWPRRLWGSLRRHPLRALTAASLIVALAVASWGIERQQELETARERERIAERVARGDRAWLDLAAGNYEQARAGFESLLQDPSVEILAGLVLALRQTHQLEAALALLRAHPDRLTEEAILHFLEIDLRLALGEDPKDVPFLDSDAPLEGGLDAFVRGTIMAYHARNGRPAYWAGAIDFLQSAVLAPDADRAAYYVALTECLYNQKRPFLARQIANALILKHGSESWAHYHAGRALWLVDQKLADQHFRRALELGHDVVSAETELWRLRSRNPKRRTEALEALAAIVERHPESHRAWGALATLHEQGGNWESARDAYAAAAERAPHWTKLRLKQGVMERRLGNHVAARALYESVVRSDPLYPKGHAYLGELMAALGEPLASRKATDRALELDPSAGWVHLNQGLLLVALRDFDAAGSHLARAKVTGSLERRRWQGLATLALLRMDGSALQAAIGRLEKLGVKTLALRDRWRRASQMKTQFERGDPALEVANGDDQLALAYVHEAERRFDLAASAWSRVPSGRRGWQPTLIEDPRFREIVCALKHAVRHERKAAALRDRLGAHLDRVSKPARRLLLASLRSDSLLGEVLSGHAGHPDEQAGWAAWANHASRNF